MAPLLVTAGIIFDGSRFLIAQRRLNDKVEPGLWEFPGGKVEFAEHPQACLRREILEELNLDIDVGELLGVSSHIYELTDRKLHVVLLCYICFLRGGELKHLAVADAKWISVEELDRFQFAAADIALVSRLRQHAFDKAL